MSDRGCLINQIFLALTTFMTYIQINCFFHLTSVLRDCNIISGVTSSQVDVDIIQDRLTKEIKQNEHLTEVCKVSTCGNLFSMAVVIFDYYLLTVIHAEY